MGVSEINLCPPLICGFRFFYSRKRFGWYTTELQYRKTGISVNRVKLELINICTVAMCEMKASFGETDCSKRQQKLFCLCNLHTRHIYWQMPKKSLIVTVTYNVYGLFFRFCHIFSWDFNVFYLDRPTQSNA